MLRYHRLDYHPRLGRPETPLDPFDEVAIKTDFANPRLGLRHVARVLGVMPETIRRLRRLSAGRRLYEHLMETTSPEKLVDYHIIRGQPIPAALAEFRENGRVR